MGDVASAVPVFVGGHGGVLGYKAVGMGSAGSAELYSAGVVWGYFKGLGVFGFLICACWGDAHAGASCRLQVGDPSFPLAARRV